MKLLVIICLMINLYHIYGSYKLIILSILSIKNLLQFWFILLQINYPFSQKAKHGKISRLLWGEIFFNLKIMKKLIQVQVHESAFLTLIISYILHRFTTLPSLVRNAANHLFKK